ncbi:MAG TPA: nitroreductase/quinone reductase family protein [Acidimicrobiales bacterium]|nr:nitroreductase/quinone reductase family protein [Acidimicrobiales bacterium]
MNDLIFKAANVIHRTVVSLSGGRLGGAVLNMPVLQLTTTGAKSGQKRTTMLTTPVQEGDTIVIVASRGGDPQHPGWFHNLKTNPDVEVSMRGAPKRPDAGPGGRRRRTRPTVAAGDEALSRLRTVPAAADAGDPARPPRARHRPRPSRSQSTCCRRW